MNNSFGLVRPWWMVKTGTAKPLSPSCNFRSDIFSLCFPIMYKGRLNRFTVVGKWWACLAFLSLCNAESLGFFFTDFYSHAGSKLGACQPSISHQLQSLCFLLMRALAEELRWHKLKQCVSSVGFCLLRSVWHVRTSGFCLLKFRFGKCKVVPGFVAQMEGDGRWWNWQQNDPYCRIHPFKGTFIPNMSYWLTFSYQCLKRQQIKESTKLHMISSFPKP